MTEEIEQYIKQHSQKEDPLLTRLNRDANVKLLNPRMVSGHIQGRLLSMISYMIRPKRILEVGTYVGYSAMCLAEGLAEGGKVITIDIDEEIEDMARAYIEQSEYVDKIDFRIADALKLIPELDEVFDLVFIDGDKREYKAYYEASYDKLNHGGFMLIDNTLWNGKVLNPAASWDHQTQALIEFNDFLAADERVDRFILDLRDGLTFVRKR